MDEIALNNNNLPANSEKKERYLLLKDRENIIEKSIQDIQESFILIGKALMEIKDMKLYQEDPIHNTWSSYVKNKVQAKLHQSTIGDYISIVRMIMSNQDIREEDIVKLGYKKAKLIKTKYNLIMKEKNKEERNKKLDEFKNIYQEVVKSPDNIPYKVCEEMFDFIKAKSKKHKKSDILKKEIHGIKISYNKTKNTITIKSEQHERLESIFDIISHIRPNQTNDLDTGSLVKVSNNLSGFIREIPKTEIHIHIEAIVSIESVFELIQKNNLMDHLGIYTLEDVKKNYQCSNLNEMVKVFYLIQSIFKSEEDFSYMVKDVRNYLLRNRIYYAEVFFSPTKFIKNGLDFQKIMNTIDLEIKRYYVEDKIDIRLIIDVSRNFGVENAMNNLDLVLNTRSESIIGIGLGGAESMEGAEAENFAKVFKKAKENGLHRVAHAGEDVGPESIWQALNILEAERIGHGISSVQDEELIKYLREHQIPLEVCPTSNVFTKKYVETLGEHPIKQMFDKGLNVTLNSDDPSIFSVDIVDEYENIYEHCGFTVNQIIKLVKNGLDSTFLSDNFKRVYWEEVHKEIQVLKEKYNIKN